MAVGAILLLAHSNVVLPLAVLHLINGCVRHGAELLVSEEL